MDEKRGKLHIIFSVVCSEALRAKPQDHEMTNTKARGAGDRPHEPDPSDRSMLSPASRACISLTLSWGCARKASLHPRLYAYTCFAGCRSIALDFRALRKSNITFVEFNVVLFQEPNELIPKRNSLMMFFLDCEITLYLQQV